MLDTRLGKMCGRVCTLKANTGLARPLHFLTLLFVQYRYIPIQNTKLCSYMTKVPISKHKLPNVQ